MQNIPVLLVASPLAASSTTKINRSIRFVRQCTTKNQPLDNLKKQQAKKCTLKQCPFLELAFNLQSNLFRECYQNQDNCGKIYN